MRRRIDGEEFQNEIRRKERLDESINQLRRSQAGARVKIPVLPEMLKGEVAGLSSGIALEPGHLHIEFSGTEDLLTKLYELSQAAANDFDRFQAAIDTVERRSL